MAYGRLDVFWPDGPFKTFALVENRISVGRSAGNTIALDTTTISRYHFSIMQEGDQVFITDLESANGTFVDGERLKPNEPHPLYGGEEIQVGHLRIQYHHLDEQPTQPMKPADETTQRLEVASPEFRVDVIAPAQPFSPGAQMSAEISVTNTASSTQRFRLDVGGMPPEWVRVAPAELTLAPNESGQALVLFRPTRRSDSRPGDYPVTVRVALLEQPEVYLDATMLVHILAYKGFGMALEQARILSGQRFRLHLHNQGSGPLPLTITGFDKAQALRYRIQPPRVTLAAGQRLVVQGEIIPERPSLFGKVKEHSFDLQVRSGDAAQFLAVARGQFLEKPLLPNWAPVAAAGAGLLALVVIVLALAVLLQPPRPPQIAFFGVNSTLIPRGQPLTINWAATDVSHLSLQINGTMVAERFNAEPASLNVDTSGLSGEVRLGLSGYNGSLETTVEKTVRVFEPIGAAVISVSPNPPLRYVLQTLSISWTVPGAASVRYTLEGLSGSTEYLQGQILSGPTQSITAQGFPQQTLRLTLLVEDELATPQTIIQDIVLLDAQCTARDRAVTLYAGPDTRYQVVGTVQPGGSVIVDGQDSSGNWLRAQLQPGLFGWGVIEQFTCPPTFKPEDLQKRLDVPPTPTPVPPTATPTPTASVRPPTTLTPGGPLLQPQGVPTATAAG